MWSVKALAVFDSKAKDWESQVNLDHVVERRDLIDQLLNASSPAEVRKILERGETCVLLRSEHKDDLIKGAKGWDRYAKVPFSGGPLVRKHKKLALS